MRKRKPGRTYRYGVDRSRLSDLDSGRGERRGEREKRQEERKAQVRFEVKRERHPGKRGTRGKERGVHGEPRGGPEVEVRLESLEVKETRQGDWVGVLKKGVEEGVKAGRAKRAEKARARAEVTGGAPGRGRLPEERVWKEDLVRVGTGYRVRVDEADPRTRRFDVGYADRKKYTRKPGLEVKVEASNMGRSLTGKGKGARVLVMNTVCAREKRRPVSEYTGSGIRRKSRVGKRKLKPTKPQAKQ